MYAQQQYQTLRRKQAMAQQAQQINQQMAQESMYQVQQQNQSLPPPQQAPQITQVPIQQPQMNHSSQVPQVAQVPIQQQYIVTSGNYTPAPPSATMAVATSNNSNYIQSAANPAQQTTTMDSSSFDRDKQIYKCSTLGRHVGKYNEQRQNLVPAVIPTVPQIPKYNGQQMTMAAPNNHLTSNNLSSTLRPSIQNCPLPDIPNIQTSTFKSNNDTIGNDLPQTR